MSSEKKSENPFEKLAEATQKIVQEGNLQDRVKMEVNQRGLVITIEGDALFKADSTNVQMKMKPLLLEIALLVKKLPYRIIVEGHTDKEEGKGGKYPSNWEISAARAGAVVRVMAEEGGADPKRFSAVGRAEFKPQILLKKEIEGKHHRVEIIISRKSQNS
jgi:chemotaxis protein MotB